MLQRSKDRHHSGHFHHQRRAARVEATAEPGDVLLDVAQAAGMPLEGTCEGADGLLDLPRDPAARMVRPGCRPRSRTRRTCSTSPPAPAAPAGCRARSCSATSSTGIEVRIPDREPRHAAALERGALALCRARRSIAAHDGRPCRQRRSKDSMRLAIALAFAAASRWRRSRSPLPPPPRRSSPPRNRERTAARLVRGEVRGAAPVQPARG